LNQALPKPAAFHGPAQSFANLSWGVAEELSGLRQQVDQLQSALSQVLASGGQALELDCCEQLQTLDYLSQHLEGLAGFLSMLASERAAQTLVDPNRALASLTLSDLRERLMQSSCAQEVDDDDPSWELF
jgi:hypothetical protein